MRGLVICWMLIGGLGFLIFPWYVTGDGFFSINWIREYSLEDYGSVLPQVFINNKYWLLPLTIPLFFPLTTLKLSQNNPLYSKIFLYSGLVGFFYFFLLPVTFCRLRSLEPYMHRYRVFIVFSVIFFSSSFIFFRLIHAFINFSPD